MRDGQCPRCGSEDVHAGSDVSNKNGAYGTNTIPITFWSCVALDNYVCVACGYVESYVANREKLEKIADTWPRVRR